eukprot:6197485-Pleurochrysis_carterae.AAC.3
MSILMTNEARMKQSTSNDKALEHDVHEVMPPSVLASRAAFWPSGLRAMRRSTTLAAPPYLRFVWLWAMAKAFAARAGLVRMRY